MTGTNQYSQRLRSTDAADEILGFWFDEAGPKKWFGGGPAFDAEIRQRYLAHYEAAAAGALDHWRASPRASLALIILLDQFSRNLFRKNPRAFAADEKARRTADNAVARRFDMIAPLNQRAFFYMPFMHSENLADQDRCCALFKARMPGSGNIRYAEEHRDIIKRFGRFPHRNGALGRTPTREEEAYLAAGGFTA